MQAAAGNTDEAIATVRRAQEVLGAIDNRDLLGDAYDHEAYVYLMLNRENDAAGAYRKAADLFEQDGNSLKEASTLRAIARIEMKNKNYDVAHDLLENAATCIAKTATCSAKPVRCLPSAVCVILSATLKTPARR